MDCALTKLFAKHFLFFFFFFGLSIIQGQLFANKITTATTFRLGEQKTAWRTGFLLSLYVMLCKPSCVGGSKQSWLRLFSFWRVPSDIAVYEHFNKWVGRLCNLLCNATEILCNFLPKYFSVNSYQASLSALFACKTNFWDHVFVFFLDLCFKIP